MPTSTTNATTPPSEQAPYITVSVLQGPNLLAITLTKMFLYVCPSLTTRALRKWNNIPLPVATTDRLLPRVRSAVSLYPASEV